MIVCGFVLGVLAYLVRTHELLQGVDNAVAPWGLEHATDFTHEFVATWTNFGATGGIVTLLVLVFVCEGIRRPSRWLPLFLVVVGVGQALVSTEIKALLDRLRPTVDAGAPLTAVPVKPQRFRCLWGVIEHSDRRTRIDG